MFMIINENYLVLYVFIFYSGDPSDSSRFSPDYDVNGTDIHDTGTYMIQVCT